MGTRKKRRRSRRIPLGLFGFLAVIAASVSAMVAWPRPTETVSELHTRICRIALSRGEHTSGAWGGPIGPWWVSAERIDPATGDLIGFTLSSGLVRLGARSAAIELDPERNTVAFVLRDVVFTNLPGQRGDELTVAMQHLPLHRLGPAPLTVNLVADPPGTTLRSLAEVNGDALGLPGD